MDDQAHSAPQVSPPAAGEAITVVIVDDRASFRAYLRPLLIRAGLSVVGEAAEIPTAEQLVRELRPDLAVVDLRLPGCNGLEGTLRLKAIHPDLRVILISAHDDPADLLQAAAQHVGAEGFIPKEALTPERIRTWSTPPREDDEAAHSPSQGG